MRGRGSRARPEGAPAAGATRIVIVNDALSDHGGVQMTLELARGLERAGVECELFVLFSPGDIGSPSKVRVRRGSSGRTRLRWAWPLTLYRLARAGRSADVLVCGSEVGLAPLFGYAAARLARRPCVAIVHAELEPAIEQWVPPRLRAVTRRVHARSDAEVCVSAELVPGVLAVGANPANVYVVENGVDVAHVRRLAAAPPPIELPSAPYVAALGRLSVEKGMDVLLRAHAAVRRTGTEHTLVIAGQGAQEAELRRVAAELGVEDSVVFAGFVENPMPLVAGAAAFVLPSRREGLSMALLEAIALGVPVIATRCGRTIEEIVAPHGQLVAPESVEELAAALVGACHGAAEAKVSETRFEHTLDRMVEGYVAVLKDVVTVAADRGGEERSHD